MNHIDISVIIPVYNRENYISKCIESVLEQKEVSTEIVIVDDGSTDATLSICREYAKANPNIKVIHQENAGISSARNKALDIARGEYITFLDSDDLIADGAFLRMLEAIRLNDVDVVVGEYSMVSEDGMIEKRGFIPDEFKSKRISRIDYWKLNSRKESNILFTVVWGKLFKREIWEKIRFGDGVRFAEDEYVLPELIEKCDAFFLLDYVVYKQTTSIGSLSRSSFDNNKLNSPESKLKTCVYLMQHSLYDCAVEKWGIAVGEILLMTRLSNDVISDSKIKSLHCEVCTLGAKLFKFMDKKKKTKYIGYRIIYPIYFAVTTIVVRKLCHCKG